MSEKNETESPSPPPTAESEVKNSVVDNEQSQTEQVESPKITEQTPVPEEEFKKVDLSDYKSELLFAHFPISARLLQGIGEKGFQVATGVQAATIEHALEGHDLLVRSKTGTGKTAAFAIPILEKSKPKQEKPQALVLAPTRELALQIGEEFSELGAYCELRLLVAYGGVSIQEQLDYLDKGADIVVGTPGRILDLIRRKALDLSALQMVCLDEADEMLSMGFYEDVHAIISKAPKTRQFLLFSATLGEQVKQLINAFEIEPMDLRLSTDADQVENIQHVLYETSPNQHKARSLLGIFINENPKSAIVFCNTRDDVSMVSSFLSLQGIDVEKLSGELPQRKREKVMRNVRSGKVQALVATDIASRGIDISHLTHVINYSLPEDPSVYLHRSGRTGRIGKKGICISLVGGLDMHTRKVLVKKHKIKFEARNIPTAEELSALRTQKYVSEIRESMTVSAFESYVPVVKELLKREDHVEILAAALRGFFIWNRQKTAENSEEVNRLENKEKRDPGQSRHTRSNKPHQNNNRNRNRNRGRSRGGNRGKDSQDT